MKKICIFNQKGGVGKTTVNVNLCSNLALLGYKVLVIDIDPQGNTTSGLGIDKREIEKSMYDVLTDEKVSLNDIIIESELISNFNLAPSTMELAGAEIELINIEDREHILKEKLKEVEDEYDFIFIDCPPSLGNLTVNALTASESVLIPIQCEFFALEGVGQLVNTINLMKKSLNKDILIEGVILNMYDARTNLSAEVAEEVNKYFGERVFKTLIPRNIRLAEAPSFGLPVILYDKRCKGAEAFNNLTQEFLSRNEGER